MAIFQTMNTFLGSCYTSNLTNLATGQPVMVQALTLQGVIKPLHHPRPEAQQPTKLL